MMTRLTAGSLAIALAGLMLLFPVPALADGGFGMGGQGGDDDPPTPGSGGHSDEDYNPTVHCTGGYGIDALLACLYYEIVAPAPYCSPNPPFGSLTGPGGTVMLPGEPAPTCFDPAYRSDWDVTIFNWGLRMQRLDAQPMKRIAFREDDPGIQTTRVFINNTPELVGRIRKLQSSAVGSPDVTGTIFVSVGYDPEPGEMQEIGDHEITIAVSTMIYKTAEAINNRIRYLLVGNGFTVYEEGNYFYVLRNSLSRWGLRLLRFRSTDPDVIHSDLALYKYGEFDAIPAGVQPPQPIE